MKKKLTDILYSFSLLLFITAFGFQHNPPSGWYQQFMPSLSNMQVSDIFFLDSLTGWAVTGNSEPNDTSGYILKTIDGGDNWNLKFTDFRDFSRVKFLDENTGFVSGGYATGARLYKSTDGGENWFALNIPGGGQIYFNDMSMLSNDTLWVVASNGLVGGVFRTTNGGISWTQQVNLGNQNPTNIYFYNKDTGYAAAGVLYKTTNSGNNWFQIPGGGFGDMHFINALTGWKCYGPMQKTTDGGLSWVNQTLPEGGNIILSQMRKFSVVNKDTIWGVGGHVFYPGTGNRGIIYRTTNGGNNWLYQVPDTNININTYFFSNFINAKIGWSFHPLRGVHTVTGGDSIFYPITSINQISSEVPSNFKLYQNYPNPFNPETKINYELRITSYVMLKVFDITGRVISDLVDERQNPGTYQYSFDGKGLSSGVYFYRIEVETERGERFIDTKKMVLQK